MRDISHSFRASQTWPGGKAGSPDRPHRVTHYIQRGGIAWPVRASFTRAAARTDAELHFLPADLVETGDAAAFGHIARPRDGVAAALRFSLTSR